MQRIIHWIRTAPINAKCPRWLSSLTPSILDTKETPFDEGASSFDDLGQFPLIVVEPRDPKFHGRRRRNDKLREVEIALLRCSNALFSLEKSRLC